MFVKPNVVDFQYVFAHAGLEDNLTIYLTLMLTIGFYILLVIWARLKDRKDKEKVRFWMEKLPSLDPPLNFLFSLFFLDYFVMEQRNKNVYFHSLEHCHCLTTSHKTVTSTKF